MTIDAVGESEDINALANAFMSQGSTLKKDLLQADANQNSILNEKTNSNLITNQNAMDRVDS